MGNFGIQLRDKCMRDTFSFPVMRLNSGLSIISVYRCIFVGHLAVEMASRPLPPFTLHSLADPHEGVGPKSRCRVSMLHSA